MKSFIGKDPGDKRDWVLIDAKNKVLGRLAAQIADILRGKDRPTYTPHVSVGSFVVVVNAEKVKLTGKKEEQKRYHRFSGWPDGLKEIPVPEMRKKHPDQMIALAVRGMLPKNHMSRTLLSRLKVYAGETHPHAAQNPKAVQTN